MAEEVPKTFGAALRSLVTVDCIRFSRLMETAQFAALYAFFALFAGVGVDRLCGLLYPVKSGPLRSAGQFWGTLGVMVLQVVLGALVVFYIRKVVQLFPLLFNFCPSRYREGFHVPERAGEMAVALVFVGSMDTLLRNIDRLREYLEGKARKEDNENNENSVAGSSCTEDSTLGL